jgi:hypothetical protein
LTHENGIPVICGYGMSTILGPSANSTALFACPIRYSAPEYFSDETGTSSVRTKAGDIYAFAMVTLEVADSTSTFFSLILALDSIGTGTISSSTDGTHRFQAHSSGWSAHSYTSRSTGNHQAHLELLDFAWISLWDQTPSSRPGMTDVVLALAKMCARPCMQDST